MIGNSAFFSLKRRMAGTAILTSVILVLAAPCLVLADTIHAIGLTVQNAQASSNSESLFTIDSDSGLVTQIASLPNGHHLVGNPVTLSGGRIVYATSSHLVTIDQTTGAQLNSVPYTSPGFIEKLIPVTSAVFEGVYIISRVGVLTANRQIDLYDQANQLVSSVPVSASQYALIPMSQPQ